MQLVNTLEHLQRHGRALTLVLALTGTLAGCVPETVYTYVQQEDGVAMKAPIRFTVRIRLDAKSKVVTWMQDAEDAQGTTNRQIRTYGDFPGSSCNVFDESNWTCEIRGTDGTLHEKPEMKNGVLSRYYWTQTQKFRKQWHLFNRNY